MSRSRSLLIVLGVVLAALGAASGEAETGDALCDERTSTPDTCAITGSFVVPDGTMLAFTAPNVDVVGTVTVQVAGQCSLGSLAPCTTDADCGAPARCERTGRLALQVAQGLTLENRAVLGAVGRASAGDVIGPGGGTITVAARDATIAGRIDVSAASTTGIPAGPGGHIELHADGAVTLAPGAGLDASTPGGCGGSILIDGGLDVTAAGTLTAEAATLGGTIDVSARDYVSAAAAFWASNTNGDLASRPACALGRGGGRVALRAARVDFTGSVRARGLQGGGGVVRFEAERGVTVDSSAGRTPISVLGGDNDAFTTGGGVFLIATGGDVTVRQGAIEADGFLSGLGSDAGEFVITAGTAMRCAAGGDACATNGDCGPGEACVETGGNVTVAAPLSAKGGAGTGSGCIACEIRGGAAVTVAMPVSVGGGKHGVGGKVTIAAGSDLTLGPGAITADAGDGGDVILVAGERSATTRDLSGMLRLLAGTQVRADGFLDDGFGGHVALDGCTVDLGQTSGVHADGGPTGGSAGIDVVAHDRLVIGALASVSALPDGALELSYGGDATVAPDADLEPPTDLVQDPTIVPCPACGNGRVEPVEDCDGRGSCAVATEVCVPPGAPGACTCQDSCGTVAGVQPGEDCDGSDLGGQTCASLGFAGGTLGCPDCTFDTAHCGAAVCGDGLVETGEACDPGAPGGAAPAFDGATCEALGYPLGGTLACAADCAAIVTGPHCATSAGDACTASADCGGAGPCVGGCVACGNGFVDPGEPCDEGEANGSAPNRCRIDCTLPRCGDEIVDFSHCAGDPGAACTRSADCAPGSACVTGEACDHGQAFCIGGENDGRPCCRADECPGGVCPGDDCSRNRDDVPGCCRCGCTSAPVGCAGCDDGNPCTADACDADGACTRAPVPDGTACGGGDVCHGSGRCERGTCVAGGAVNCDDADACTIDTCDLAQGCRHARVDFADARRALEATVFLPVCAGDTVPRAIPRLLHRAHALVARAAAASPHRAATLLRRAAQRLRGALARTSRPRVPACRNALAELVADGLARVACLEAAGGGAGGGAGVGG